MQARPITGIAKKGYLTKIEIAFQRLRHLLWPMEATWSPCISEGLLVDSDRLFAKNLNSLSKASKKGCGGMRCV